MKVKNKQTGEIVNISKVDYETCLGYKIKYTDGLFGNYTESEFHDLYDIVEDIIPPENISRKELIEHGAKDFVNRFTGVMKDLAEENDTLEDRFNKYDHERLLTFIKNEIKNNE